VNSGKTEIVTIFNVANLNILRALNEVSGLIGRSIGDGDETARLVGDNNDTRDVIECEGATSDRDFFQRACGHLTIRLNKVKLGAVRRENNTKTTEAVLNAKEGGSTMTRLIGNIPKSRTASFAVVVTSGEDVEALRLAALTDSEVRLPLAEFSGVLVPEVAVTFSRGGSEPDVGVGGDG